MGAINQAFNHAVGSVAAAATMIKGEKDAIEQDISQALLGKEQYHEAEADIKDYQDRASEYKNK